MKKDNRKKRKLKFIREKNKIRAGHCVHFRMKVSNDLTVSRVDWDIFVYKEYHIVAKQLQRKWHLKFMPVNWMLSTEGKDFMYDQKTLRLTFKHFPI